MVLLSAMEGADAAAPIILDGTCVNQDGRSSSLTAPNGPAQQFCMRLVLHDAQHMDGAGSHVCTHPTSAFLE